MLDAVIAGGCEIRHLVLGQDYRDGDVERLAADVRWARAQLSSAISDPSEARP